MITRLHTIFKYDNARSIKVLGQNLLTEMPNEHTLSQIAAHVIYNNLIKIPIGIVPKMIFVVMPRKWQWLMCKQLGCSMYNDGTIKKFFVKTIQHMVTGVDTDDPKSAGGWNETEFKLFLSILHDHGYTYDQDPWWLIMDIEEGIKDNVCQMRLKQS